MLNIIPAIIGVVCLVLHIILSKKENKFLGLILPTINVLFSINAVVGFAMFNGVTNTDATLECISIFFMYNISTIILLCIYYSCRKKLNKNNEQDKMNIQDLN